MAAHFQAFPYVNGGLFEADEPVPEFGRKARRLLIDCGNMDWSEINPDIFGSMFQAVIDEEQRGNLGQHYTSVSNIMKVVQPLFLDKLFSELDRSRKNERKIKEFLLRLQKIRIFDPACGSGNFLIIAYKELRRLEMEAIDALNAVSDQTEMYYSGIKLSQFFGIEIDDFAHEVAILSLWLAEHQMNMAFKEKFGYADAALPLSDSGHIVCGNSLRLDWEDVCPLSDKFDNSCEVYICGNPPFLGARVQDSGQKEDMSLIYNNRKEYKDCDYVTCWFLKASDYSVRSKSQFAFVSTSSICQGEQVDPVWSYIFKNGQDIKFAFKPFPWSNNAKNSAGIVCSIIGVGDIGDKVEKHIYDGKHKIKVDNISPYLAPGSSIIVKSRKKGFDSKMPKMVMGNMARDGGNLIATNDQKERILAENPQAQKLFRPLVGSKELLNGIYRWAIWIDDSNIEIANNIPEIQNRINNVYDLRISSKAKTTNQYASTPHKFAQRTVHDVEQIMIPGTSSDRRPYIPMGVFDKHAISSNANMVILTGDLYIFGVLTSKMHYDWVGAVCGRLGSGYRYSSTVVYNNYAWPSATEEQREHIKELAEEILLAREDYPDKSLSQLYDPDEMPSPLREAHEKLDKAVEKLYRDKPFRDATERLEHLFARYEKLIAEEKAKKPAKKTAKGSN